MKPKPTERGEFIQDPSGLWHYRHTKTTGLDSDAARDAIEHQPLETCWFWHNGTPAPIQGDDSPTTLLDRYKQWRLMLQKSPEALKTFTQYAGMR